MGQVHSARMVSAPTQRDAEEALRKAARDGDLATLKRLVEMGVSVNAEDENNYGYTALMYAAREGKLDCLEHLAAKSAMASTANVNVWDNINWTALHHAAAFGRADCVESLLKAGADASLKDDSGRTALDLAKLGAHTEVMKLLV